MFPQLCSVETEASLTAGRLPNNSSHLFVSPAWFRGHSCPGSGSASSPSFWLLVVPDTPSLDYHRLLRHMLLPLLQYYFLSCDFHCVEASLLSRTLRRSVVLPTEVGPRCFFSSALGSASLGPKRQQVGEGRGGAGTWPRPAPRLLRVLRRRDVLPCPSHAGSALGSLRLVTAS